MQHESKKKYLPHTYTFSRDQQSPISTSPSSSSTDQSGTSRTHLVRGKFSWLCPWGTIQRKTGATMTYLQKRRRTSRCLWILGSNQYSTSYTSFNSSANATVFFPFLFSRCSRGGGSSAGVDDSNAGAEKLSSSSKLCSCFAHGRGDGDLP